ncbi:MAG: hypothetical protein JO261_12610 [Alphaproteobacteria bacterium]|nr:hypothetical protein [Alphaproteobacteria bacterium]MBV9694532.1 hypothetical protein [Alphaproteobacteria bacterium]
MAPLKVTRSIRHVIAFVFQVILGSIAFLLFYLVAAGVSYAVGSINKWLSLTAPWLLGASNYIEIALFGLDVIAFGLFAVFELAHFARALWRQWVDE